MSTPMSDVILHFDAAPRSQVRGQRDSVVGGLYAKHSFRSQVGSLLFLCRIHKSFVIIAIYFHYLFIEQRKKTNSLH